MWGTIRGTLPMHASIGILRVTLKNTYIRGKTIIYQRVIPKALQHRYTSRTIKHDLKTNDVAVAAKAVAVLNKRYAAEWSGLKASPSASPSSVQEHAGALLKAHGLTPGGAGSAPEAEDVFFDKLQDRHERYAGGDREVYEAALPTDYLPAVELAALKLLKGTPEPDKLQDALELYLSVHPKRDNTTFSLYSRRAFATLIEVAGNREVAAFKRADARAYLDATLASSKTTTVRRRLGMLTAVFATYYREKNLATPNPFAKLAIAGEGVDSTPRVPFTDTELVALYRLCRERNDSRRWLVAMLIDTGARLAEVTGLALADIVLDAAVPHMVIKAHPWRTLKNASSARVVPLVGASLWAAQSVVANALPSQRHAFPRYTSDTECRAAAASAALVKWVKSQGFNHVLHELRHTMADRLRNVGCPKDIRYSIDGHASQDVGDDYGIGHGLPIMASWLDKVALPLALSDIEKTGQP